MKRIGKILVFAMLAAFCWNAFGCGNMTDGSSSETDSSTQTLDSSSESVEDSSMDSSSWEVDDSSSSATLVDPNEVQITREGLYAWYDGANNSNGTQDMQTTVWKDLSGNERHMTVTLNENNYWEENALHVDSTRHYFHESITDVVNGDEYTVEFVAGTLTYYGWKYPSLVISENDEFSMFIRVETNEFEFKYNDANEDRPKISNGATRINNVTVSIVFDIYMNACTVYLDGEVMTTNVPQVTNIADALFFCHDDENRNWSGDIYAFRFYDRALNQDEIEANAAADYKKYRSGNVYVPEVQ